MAKKKNRKSDDIIVNQFGLREIGIILVLFAWMFIIMFVVIKWGGIT